MSGLTNPVMSESDLNNDLLIMSTAASGSYTITLGAGFTLGSDIEMVNLLPGVTLTVNGAGNTIDGGGLYRGFLVYAGDVSIDNLTLNATAAIGGAGGAGKEGGGGGGGFGGGLFVAAAGTVMLAGVTMTNSQAIGGAGGYGGSGSGYGGGGGMGGAGGNGGSGYGTGGGGLGNGATGAAFETTSGSGIAANAGGGGNGYQHGGSSVTDYGAGAGGGGGLGIAGGGGGGIGGAGGAKYSGGIGGFGGGGGGFSYYGAGSYGGGAGGFGGGAGAGNGGTMTASGFPANPNQGGFGGGGGGDKYGGYGGLGAGSAGTGSTAGGGGGLGAGGDIFVQEGGQLTIQSGSLTGGTASGGAAGNNGANGGIGVAGGIFLQGGFGTSQSMTLAPGAGQTLTIADPIADEEGAFGAGEALTGNLLIGAGTVQLTGANTYTGGTTLAAGATLVLGSAASAGRAGSGPIAFAAPSDMLEVGMGGGATIGLGNIIAGLNVNDAIDVLGFAQTGGSPATMLFNATLDQITLEATVASVPSHRILQLDTGRGYDAEAFGATVDGAGTGTLITYAACYLAGTRIATETGELPVEQLAAGMRVRSAFGGTVPVVWIGHREFDCARHARPHEVWPVRVARDAFGPARPARTLWLSPDHAVFVEPGVLVPVRYLLNGATVAQVPRRRVSYWHVELPAHDVVFAEGLAAESYLDTGNRGAFANGGAAVRLHADFVRHVWQARGCAPLVVAGPAVEATRAALLRRAQDVGFERTADPDLRLFAGEAPITLEDGAARLPAGTPTVRLRSRAFVPAEHGLAADHRRLGVAVTRLVLDREEVALDDARLGVGWHAAEPGLRWTDGAAEIRTDGARTLALGCTALGQYWRGAAGRRAA